MTTIKRRQVRNTWQGHSVVEGAGVNLKRVFSFEEVFLLDPFLLLDDFHVLC